MGNLLTKLFSPKSDLSPAHMSGPVGVGRLYYKLFEHPDGWRMVLWFSVIFNINLAIINMLPFPLLDGGHITMALGEAITRRPPSGAWMERIQFLCVILLFGFIAFVTLKDTGDIIGDSKPDPKWAEFTTDSKPPVREWLPEDKRTAPAPAAAAPAPAR
jgi:regulator of sigma E protease